MSIEKLVDERKQDMVETRRYLHKHPELSFKEFKTYQFILDRLNQYDDIDIIENVGANDDNSGKGIVASFGEGHPHIAFRADFDALPIQDKKEVEYKSTVDGVMHACGHDAHTTTLLTLVDVVSNNLKNLKGKVSFIFQYGEEEPPGGAEAMIKDGILKDVDFVYGQHYWSQFDTHEIHSKSGALIATPDKFRITIQGRGGHAAYPQRNIDAILIASELIVNLQSIVSRQISPIDNAVVSFGHVKAGDTFNVMPDSAVLEGTVRTFDYDVREKIVEIFESEVEATTKKRGATGDLYYHRGFPPVINHEREAKIVEEAAKSLGLEYTDTKPLMIGEDFSYFIEEKPGAFFLTGSGNESKNSTYAHHHELFDLDEEAMESALKMFMKIIELENIIEWN